MRSIHELVDMGLEVATSDTSGATGLAVLGAVAAGAAAIGVLAVPQSCFSEVEKALNAWAAAKERKGLIEDRLPNVQHPWAYRKGGSHYSPEWEEADRAETEAMQNVYNAEYAVVRAAGIGAGTIPTRGLLKRLGAPDELLRRCLYFPREVR